MDITNYIRDGKRAAEAWTYPKGSDVIIANKDCKVYFPKSYTNGKLGSIDDRINVIAIFGIVVEDKYYGVSNAMSTIPLTPDGVTIVKIDDVEYYELSWNAGSVVCPNGNLTRNNNVAYEVYNEFITKGKTPWYMSYTDLMGIFDTAASHADANLNADHAILELFTASRARQSKDRTKYFREQLKKQDDLDRITPDIIPLKSIAFGASNTTARLMGANLGNEGLPSSMVNTSEENERIEDLLRQ